MNDSTAQIAPQPERRGSVLPDVSSYKTLAKALEPLELEGRLRYLPSFECCGSCARARFHGFMGDPGEDWGDYELYVTFNEQTKERADDGMELWLTVWSFDPSLNDEGEEKLKTLIAEALVAGGFEEIEKPSNEEYYGRPGFDPEFRCNSFYRDGNSITVRGWFEGEAKPTKAVRNRAKELKLNR